MQGLSTTRPWDAVAIQAILTRFGKYLSGRLPGYFLFRRCSQRKPKNIAMRITIQKMRSDTGDLLFRQFNTLADQVDHWRRIQLRLSHLAHSPIQQSFQSSDVRLGKR